jgi:hypothetical protein
VITEVAEDAAIASVQALQYLIRDTFSTAGID